MGGERRKSGFLASLGMTFVFFCGGFKSGHGPSRLRVNMPCPYGGAMLRNFWGGLRGLFGKRRGERELDEELRDFLEESAAEKVRGGMTREEARRAARMEMGGMEVVKE